MVPEEIYGDQDRFGAWVCLPGYSISEKLLP